MGYNPDSVLVWSNAVYLLPIVVLLFKSWRNRTKFGTQIGILLGVLVASSIHHSADTASIQKRFGISPNALYVIDLLLSYLSIVVATPGAFYHRTQREVYNAFAIPVVITVTALCGDSTKAAAAMIACAFALFVFHEIPRWLKQPMVFVKILPAAALMSVAIWAKSLSDQREQADDPPHYRTYHTLWHVFGGLAAAVLFCDLEHDTEQELRLLQEHKQMHRRGRRYSIVA